MPHHHHHHDPSPLDTSGGPPPDPAQESLVRALRASFNILRVLIVVLVVLYIFTGVFRVEAGERGLVARLGRLVENPRAKGSYVFGPGWYFWMLPDPFDHKFKLEGQVRTLAVTTFMFEHKDATTAKNLAEILTPKNELTPGVDGAMLTGDKNLSHGRWEVQYRLKIREEDGEDGAAAFVRNVGADWPDFEPLLRRLTETAVTREVAGRTVEEVTRQALDAVRSGVQRRLQAVLDELNTGVKVVEVVGYTVVPGAVQDAFNKVQEAENEKLRLEREAEARATEIRNRAAGSRCGALLELIREYGRAQSENADEQKLAELRARIDDELLMAAQLEAGLVAVRLREARAMANDIHARLASEYSQFTERLKERAAGPRIAPLGLWTQMREEVLGTLENEIFIVPDSDIVEILLNRDVQRVRELEEERIRQRQMRPAGPGR